MKKINLILITLILFGCNQNSSDKKSAVEVNNLFTDSTFNQEVNQIENLDHQLSFLDSTYPEKYDTSKYNSLTVNAYYSLSKATLGKTYFAADARQVPMVIAKILDVHAIDGSEIMFLIDNSSSMEDDIEAIKSSLELIIEKLKKYKKVKAGVVIYEDKNAHPESWYSRLDLTYDLEKVKKYISRIKLFEDGLNTDWPESVNDAIGKTVIETNWRSPKKRMMLIIGDAHSLEPPLSEYSKEDIIRLANNSKVKMNLYPVIINVDNSINQVFQKKMSNYAQIKESDITDKTYEELNKNDKLIHKIYPNPAKTNCTIEFKNSGKYEIAIFDMKSTMVMSKIITDIKVNIDVSSLAKGMYVVRVYSMDNHSSDRERLIIN